MKRLARILKKPLRAAARDELARAAQCAHFRAWRAQKAGAAATGKNGFRRFSPAELSRLSSP